MKLSTKIIFGFALTNLVYLLLSTAIFLFVWPLRGISNNLNTYVQSSNDSTSELRYEASEMRSFIMQYSADPDLDPKLLETAMDSNTPNRWPSAYRPSRSL